MRLNRRDFTNVEHEGRTYRVSNDYLMQDGVRLSLGMTAINQILQDTGAILPDKGLVDAIWKASDVKLSPKPLPPGPQMTSPEYIARHSRLVDEQLAELGNPKGLIAGHKKDVVVSHRRGRIAIYGWHYPNGKPIQPYSTVHHWEYADYSQGLRLIFLDR